MLAPKYRYTEATPVKGYPVLGGTEWPTDAEYKALRIAKAQWDTSGETQSWCACVGRCDCSGRKDFTAFPVTGEWTPRQEAKWAGVCAANNKFGYESFIYRAACGAGQANDYLMRWDGVPLRVQDAQEQVSSRQTVHVPGAAVNVQRGGVTRITASRG